MNPEKIRDSLHLPHPPKKWPEWIRALWWDARGDWDRAHRIAQEDSTLEGSRVHAYLHRKEGDLWNADYWYRRAGSSRPDVPLNEEWEYLISTLS